MPKPLTKPRPTLPWRLCRPSTATLSDVGAESATKRAARATAPSIVSRSVRILPGRMPITGGDPPVPPAHGRSRAVTGRSFTESSPTSATSGRVREPVRRHRRAAADHGLHRAGGESSSSTMSARWPGATRPRSNRPKCAGRRPGGGAIGVERPHAAADGGADQVIDVALLGDVERVAVVGAEGQERRALGRRAARPAREILGHRALADQDLHALGELLARLGGRRRLVAVAHAGGDIGVEVVGRRAAARGRRSARRRRPRACRSTSGSSRARPARS